MNAELKWLSTNYDGLLKDLAAMVAIPRVSTDGKHQREVARSAKMVVRLMKKAGLEHARVLKIARSNEFAYAEWLHAPGKPTILLYSHHDVQPPGPAKDWRTPWKVKRKNGRLYGRGTADDKGATISQLAAVAAFLSTTGSLPVNIKMLVEGEEEIGSPNLMKFFKKHKKLIQADAVVVCDTENLDQHTPCLTHSLRGLVEVLVEVESAMEPRHSGTAGGLLADAAIALNVILARLYWKNGELPIPGIQQGVVPMSDDERKALGRLPFNEATLRKEMGVLDEVKFANCRHPYEQTWRWPAVTITAQEASSFAQRSNQVLPRAAAYVSCRIVPPDQDPDHVFACLKKCLTDDPPWGVKVKVTKTAAAKPWMTDPTGPAFEAAKAAMQAGFGRTPAAIGCGGTIGFVRPLVELLDNAPALLLGIEDPKSNPHAPNESLDEGIFKNLMASLVRLFENIGNLSKEELRR